MSQYRDLRIAFPVFFTDEDAQIFTEIYVAKSGVKRRRISRNDILFNQENLYETEESKNEFGKNIT